MDAPQRHHRPLTDQSGFRIPSSGEGGYEFDPPGAWGMDVERHDTEPRREPCSLWVRPWQTGQSGRYAWKIRCGCGIVFPGPSEASVKAKLREHLERRR